MQLKRYDEDRPFSGPGNGMAECADGDYVRFDDVQPLLERLRQFEQAQADARPAAWQYRTRYGENTSQPGWHEWEELKPRDPSQSMEERVREMQSYIDGGAWYELRPLYTHPEASAPGLINLLREARATLEMWKDVAPAVSLCADIDKALTRASAATVAEPSKTATRGAENMPKRGTLAWLIRLLQQLQGAGTASEAKVYINDPTFGRVEVGGALYGIADVELTPNDDDEREEAAPQQAEPGADEPTAFDVGVRGYKALLVRTRHEADDTAAHFRGRGCEVEVRPLFTAAPSGQRAGVAEDAARFRWLLDGNGFFMEEQVLCCFAPCSDDEKANARRAIDEAMNARSTQEG